MFRTNITRITCTSSRPVVAASVTRLVAVRSHATYTPPPPPSGQPAPNQLAKESDNTLIYTALGLAVAGGAYLYFRNPNELEKSDNKAKVDQERMKQKGRETVDSARAQVDDTLQKGRAKVDQAEGSFKKNFDVGRSRVGGTTQGAEAQGRGLFDEVEDKLDSAKTSTKESLTRAKDSTENLYHEVRDTVERKSAEVRAETDRKAEGAKEGWFSWLGFGKTKVGDVKNKVKQGEHRFDSEAERLKREAASRVANAAEDVRIRAEKRA